MREQETIQIIFEQVLHQPHSHPVKDVNLVLGELYDITAPNIQKRWDELSRGTPVEQARLRFRSIKAEVQCMACLQKYHPADKKIHCPYCGSFGARILTGEEFYLESIQLDQD